MTTFDPQALREKYRTERDKRLRPDGNDQYVEMANAFAHYLDDPYSEPIERAPLEDDVGVVVIGGGFGGLLVGARLREAGIGDFRLIEKGGDVGGTWYWNRYPGAACDVESYIYLPLLEELGYIPTEKYARAPEILAHSRAIAHHFGLYERACLQTEVTDVRWDEGERRWIVSTNRRDRMRARFVVMANGPLHRPKLPGIPGVETFAGHSFHTSRWDYDYTGGTSDGNLDRLHDKTVGIIGTGATAVQCVPHLGAAARQLYVFQRTPSSIDVRNNRPTDPGWSASLAPGWQRRRMDNFNNLVSGIPEPEDLVNDGWTDIIGKLLLQLRSEPDARHEEHRRQPGAGRLREDGADPRARRRDRPRRPQRRGAQALLPAVLQATVLPRRVPRDVQSSQRHAGRHERPGRRADHSAGRRGRGTRVRARLPDLSPPDSRSAPTMPAAPATRSMGRDGVTLTEKWRDGASTFQGFHSRGFPNCFIVSLVQSGFSVNFPHMLDEQAKHLAYILREALDRGVRRASRRVSRRKTTGCGPSSTCRR